MKNLLSGAYMILGVGLLVFGPYAWRRGWLNYEPKPIEGLAQVVTKGLQSANQGTRPPGRRRSMQFGAGEAAPVPASPPHPRPSQWRIRGEAYDLMSLHSVPGARIVFTDKNSGKRSEILSDADGKYDLSLPSLGEGGYSVSVRHERYRDLFLEDGDIPFRQMDRRRREEYRATMRTANVVHVPILLPDDQSELEYNLVLTRP